LAERRRDEEGFTLIELMVVVLIMGILMAIAIPTFLSTRSSANDASAKSNATNAYTNEKSYYASNQVFLDTSLNSNGNSLDNSLPWQASVASLGTAATAGNVTGMTGVNTAGKFVEVTATPYQGSILVVEALSKSNNCYYIEDSETSSAAYIGYGETSGGCAANTLVTVLTAAAATGSAGGNTIPVGTTAGPTWYQSW
jgi:prepilin-type N-terminal cleavage/methylation domain-containing protein